MKETNAHLITEEFHQLVKLANKLEKTPRRFGTDEPLTGTEIHLLLKLIGDNGECLKMPPISPDYWALQKVRCPRT